MDKTELKRLFEEQKILNMQSDLAHKAYLKMRGKPEEFDAELAWLVSIRLYAKSKVAYDSAIDQFVADLSKVGEA